MSCDVLISLYREVWDEESLDIGETDDKGSWREQYQR